MEKITIRPYECAKLLSVSPRKLFEMTKSGGFPHVKNGRTILYEVKDVIDWLESQKKINGGVKNGDPH